MIHKKTFKFKFNNKFITLIGVDHTINFGKEQCLKLWSGSNCLHLEHSSKAIT